MDKQLLDKELQQVEFELKLLIHRLVKVSDSCPLHLPHSLDDQLTLVP